MGKIAFVFPGQGAQYPGMGKELASCAHSAAKVFAMADAIRPGTSSQCFESTEEVLKETKITQPCIFAVELAAAKALNERGIYADMVAGFSLGELAAVSYGHMVDESTCFKMVSCRGELMQEAAEKIHTAMAAVVKLSTEEVEVLCSKFQGVYPVNFNCPGQVTVACLAERLPEFSAAVKAAGGRALPLKVSGGFHSPFMAQAAREFARMLEDVEFFQPMVPVYSDVTGEPYGAETKELLAKQICEPVRWEQIVRHMINSGADTFIEVGPGSVLSGLIGKIDKNVRTFQVYDRESLENCVREVSEC